MTNAVASCQLPVSSMTVGSRFSLTVLLSTAVLPSINNDISKVKMSFVVRRAIVAWLQSLLFLVNRMTGFLQDLQDERATPKGESPVDFQASEPQAGGMPQRTFK